MTPVVSLRRLLSQRTEAGRPELRVLSVYRDHGVIPKDSRDDNYNKTPEDLTRYLHVRPGDLVVNKMKAWSGSLGVSTLEGIVSPDYLVCEIEANVEGRYLHHVLRSSALIEAMKVASRGIRPNQERLYWDDLGDIAVRLPSLQEQRRIADFLDDQVARIDAAVSARARTRLLVEEKFLAWLDGQYDNLARNIGTDPLRRHLLEIRQGWSPQCEDRRPGVDEWGVLKSGCVNGGRFDPTQVKALPEGVEPRRELTVHPGDLLVNRASGSLDLIGSAAIVTDEINDKVLLCDKVYRLRLAPSLDPAFYVAIWSTSRCREELKLWVSGAEGMANSLPSTVIRAVRLPVPTLSTQRDWLRQFDSRVADKVALSDAYLHQELLLQERKRALITAAVMGEFDVSSAGPRTASVVMA